MPVIVRSCSNSSDFYCSGGPIRYARQKCGGPVHLLSSSVTIKYPCYTRPLTIKQRVAGFGVYGHSNPFVRKWPRIYPSVAPTHTTSDHAPVISGYQFLMRHYSPGDIIFMFGFSRGADTARLLALMLEMIGLLKPAKCIFPVLLQPPARSRFLNRGRVRH